MESLLESFLENLKPLLAGASIGWGVGLAVAGTAALLSRFTPPGNLFLILVALVGGTFLLLGGLAAAVTFLFGTVSAWVLVPLAIACCFGVWHTANHLNLPPAID